MLKAILRPAALLQRSAVNVMLSREIHVKEEKIKVKDLNINYVQSGDGEKSVLLLPGALGSAWTDFKPQIEKLPELLPNHTIIAWDPPGYGNSRPPKRKFGLDFYHSDAQYAVELMKALDRPTFSMIGWSDGGVTALIIAGRYTGVAEKMVIWGSGPCINKDEVKGLQGIKDVNKWSPRMREAMEKMYGVREFAELWADYVDAAEAILTDRDGDFCRKEADNIKIPTLILHGKKDPLVAAEHIPYLLKRIPGVKYHEFPEGKHNIHLRYQDEFNSLVKNFLLDKD